MTRLLLYGGLLALATACSKDQVEPTIDFGPNNGFTMRTGNNSPAAQTDPTDWTTDTSWNDTEQQLFANLKLSLTSPQVATGNWETSAYPNPSSRNAGFTFMIMPSRFIGRDRPTGTCRVALVIVDAHYKSELTYDGEIAPTGTFLVPRLDPVKYETGTLHRLYYVVYQPGKQVYYRGHGDLKLEA